MKHGARVVRALCRRAPRREGVGGMVVREVLGGLGGGRAVEEFVLLACLLLGVTYWKMLTSGLSWNVGFSGRFGF